MFSRLRRKIYRPYNNRTLNSGLIYFIILSLFIFMLIEGFFFLERRLRPAIISIAEIQAHARAVEAVNRAIMETITDDYLYQDLISIKQDDHGKIVMAQVNTMEINRFMAKITLTIQDTLTNIMQKPFKIPLGKVFNNYLLATYGPGIPVRLMPIGKVSTHLQDSFEEAGINQVRHKIYLEVSTEVRIVVPLITSEKKVHTTVPLTDAIYPGKVPDTFINLDLGR